ncbi:ATP-binding protein [Mycobacterium sp. 1465703.0]|nr:ATP-binding protein [Mycobacterium sp. 1465703.0]
MEGVTVEVKIGITESPRELVLASAQTPGEVEELVSTALSDGSGLLRLSDERGRRFLIHTSKIAYVEIGIADARRVGFGITAESGKHAGKGH